VDVSFDLLYSRGRKKFTTSIAESALTIDIA